MIPGSDLIHFERCPVCGEEFDMRDLSQVGKHDHERPGAEPIKLPKTEGKREAREEDLN